MTENLAPDSVSSPDQWELHGSGTKVTAVALPDDEFTSAVRCSDLGWIQRYTLPATNIPAGSTINSVSVSSRATSWGDSGAYSQGLALSSNTSESSDIETGGGNYWTTTVNALSRPGGGSWSQSDLDSLEVYVKGRDPSTYTYVTTLFVIIDYTPPAEGPAGNMLLMFH